MIIGPCNQSASTINSARTYWSKYYLSVERYFARITRSFARGDRGKDRIHINYCPVAIIIPLALLRNSNALYVLRRRSLHVCTDTQLSFSN